jgi:spoIIIJ-associated protein
MSESPRFVEATGPDVETAIKNGLQRLNANSKDVIVEVIEESSRGLFGIGGRPAKVRLTLLAPSTPPAPTSSAPAQAKPRQQEGRSEQRSERRGDRGRRGGKKSSGRGQSNRSSGARTQDRPRREATARHDAADRAEEAGEEQVTRPPSPDDDEARVSLETLQELLSKMKIDAEVAAYYVEAADENEEGPLVLQVSGRDLGMLIGRRGETLAALQYITRLIVSRDLQRRANLVVDVERYKSRRERRLRSLALRMAKQATQRGRTVTLEPMAAYERRIVHLALRDRTDVYTQSVGEGDDRKVTIVPVRDR